MEKLQVHQSHRKHERTLEAVDAFGRELLVRLQLDLALDSREEDGIVHINLTGPDRPYLLSNAASLLNNLEYLLNKIFPGSREEAPGISLDSDNYRHHRALELKLLAEMAAQKVLSSGRPLSLQPMVPRERRLVHMTLAGIEGVRSQSEGEGDSRSITIYPS